MEQRILEHSIDNDIGKVICYRMRSEDLEWKELEGKISEAFKRGAKMVRIFYPDEAQEAPFYVSCECLTIRRGCAWRAKESGVDTALTIISNFREQKFQEYTDAIHRQDTISNQLAFLRRVESSI